MALERVPPNLTYYLVSGAYVQNITGAAIRCPFPFTPWGDTRADRGRVRGLS